MKVSVFGSGYVGLVTGVCLAEVGHDVICMDVDENKIEQLNKGIIPIFEPGLESMVKENADAGRLRFTSDAVAAIEHGLVQFIAVGTPPDEDGSADLQYVLAVAETIATHMTEYRLIVDKSTVPVGTADQVKVCVQETLAARSMDIDFDIVSNPEFLKEGAAIDDFMKPDRIIVGIENDTPKPILRELYAPFNRNHNRIVMMDVRSAELTKYAANAMLATKISFMNELANLAEILDADIEQVRLGIGADQRIGYHFIYPGCGYGGSCFPKDVKALIHTSNQVHYRPELLTAVEAVNDRQKMVMFEKMQHHFNGDLAGKTIALWGLAFKPGTDDMREAPSRVLIQALSQAGANIQAYDPEAMQEARRIYGDAEFLSLHDSAYAALENADTLLVVTEWKAFRNPDFERIKQRLTEPVIFDGRNIYDPAIMKANGFNYYAIGRTLP